MNRWAPALSVLLLCLGLVLIAGVGPQRPAPVAPPIAATTASSATAASASPSASATSSVAVARPIADGYRIKIPRLAIDLPLAEGDVERDAVRYETPDNFAFHLPGTAIPGDGGNSYIYAHARRGMFLSLWDARAGDEVLVITPDAREMRYVVSEVHPRVDATDLSWVAPTGSERLTLQTSTGPNPADPRFVVVAVPG